MGINVGDLTGSVTLEDQLSDALTKIHERLTLAGLDFNDLNKAVVSSDTALKQAATFQISLQAELAKSQVLSANLTKEMNDLAAASTLSAGAERALASELTATSEKVLIANSNVSALKDSMAVLDKQFNTVAETSEITSQKIVAFGRGVQEAGIVASTVFTAPIVAAGAAVLDFSADFEKAMTKAQILGGLTAEEMRKFDEVVLNIAKDMGIAPAQVAVGLDIVGSAMYKGAEAADILTRSTKMSALGMGTVEETTRAVVGAMLAYKSENLTAAQASDTLLKTVQLGNMQIQDLVGSLAKINPLAAAMGIKFSDVNAAIATFTHLGAPAEVASTGIRAVLSNLLNDGAKTEKGLKELGISMADVQRIIAEKGLTEALLYLVDAAGKTEDGIKKLGEVFPNIRGLTLVLADAKAQGKSFLETSIAIRDSAGTLDQAFAQVKGTWVQQWNEILAASQVAAIHIGTELLPGLKTLASVLTTVVIPAFEGVISIFTELPGSLQAAGIGFVGLVAIIGPAMILIGEMIRSYGHISALLKDIDFAGMASGVKTWIGSLEGATIATTALNVALTAMLAAAALWGAQKIFEAGGIIWDIWTNHVNAAKDAANQNAADLRAMAEAQKYATGPIKDAAEAYEILNKHAKELRDAHQALATGIPPVTEEMKKATFQANLLASEHDHAKYAVQSLNPDLVLEATSLFQLGLSSAETFKHLKDHKLVTDEQKVAVEQLNVQLKEEDKTLNEIAKAHQTAAMALIPLTTAQKAEAEQLLALGVSHDTIAKAINAHVAQVNALVKSDQELVAAQKLDNKIMEDSAISWAQYFKDVEGLGADSVAKAKAGTQQWLEDQIAKHVLAKTDTADFYNFVYAEAALKDQKIEQSALQADVHSKAHAELVAEQARIAYQFATEHANQYTQEWIDHLQKVADASKLAADTFGMNFENSLGKVNDSIQKTIGAFHQLQMASQAASVTGPTETSNQALIDQGYSGLTGYRTVNELANGTFPGGEELARRIAHGMRAMGGPVDRDTPYIVGEKGPELFTPSATGYITPNDAIGRSSSASPIIIQVSGVMDPRTIREISNAVGEEQLRQSGRKF